MSFQTLTLLLGISSFAGSLIRQFRGKDDSLTNRLFITGQIWLAASVIIAQLC